MDTPLTHSERNLALQGLVASSAWRQILEPMLKQKIAIELQALVETGDDVHRGAFEAIRHVLAIGDPPPSSARRRGRIKALQQFLAWPHQTLVQDTLDEDRKKKYNQDQATWEHYATWGRHSPVLPPDYPGSEGDS